MSRMSKILGQRQEGDSLFIRVQPGLLLTQLNKMLEQKSFDVTGWSAESQKILEKIKAGQWIFPPDPTEISASIGGMVSCNASGAKTFCYGPTRNYVEAIRACLLYTSARRIYYYSLSLFCYRLSDCFYIR